MIPVAGQHYKHFRNQKTYEIIGIGIDTKDDNSVVIYKGLYIDSVLGEHPLFVRGLKEFTGMAETDSGLTKRFQLQNIN